MRLTVFYRTNTIESRTAAVSLLSSLSSDSDSDKIPSKLPHMKRKPEVGRSWNNLQVSSGTSSISLLVVVLVVVILYCRD